MNVKAPQARWHASASAEAKKPSRVDISVVIVTWNVASLVEHCIESLSQLIAHRRSSADTGKNRADEVRPTIEIIVVDSASSDDTIPRLRKLRGVRVLGCSENVGYGRGSNLGAAAAVGDYLLFLNPDTEVCGDAVSAMWRAIVCARGAWIMGPQLVDTSGASLLIPRVFPTLAGTAFDVPVLLRFTPASLKRRESLRAPESGCARVDWVLGCAMLMSRVTFATLGGFDEGFALYSEEVDLCRRARRRGVMVGVVGGAKVLHLGGRSTAQRPLIREALLWQSQVRYFVKHKSVAEATLLLLIAVFSYLLEWFAATVRGWRHGRTDADVGDRRRCAETLRQMLTRSARAGLERAS